MTARLRTATPADAARCAAILRSWIAVTPWYSERHTLAADRGFVLGKILVHRVIVAEAPEIVGFLALEEEYISCLYVAEGHQGRGIGRRLLESAKAARPSLALWTYQANHRARAFYLREGFRERRHGDGRDNAAGLPDVEYVWTRDRVT